MKKTLLLILFVLLPFVSFADGNSKLIKIYRDKTKGNVDYLLIDPDNINYIQWLEGDGRLLIAFHGGFEYIKAKTEDDAIKIIEDIYDSSKENWTTLENDTSSKKKKSRKSRTIDSQIPF